MSRGRRDLSEKGYRGSAARLMPAGTVLFSSRAPIGYCAIASNEISTNQGFKSFLLKGEISAEYVRYYLLASVDYAESRASGTTFKELSGSRAAELALPIAPVAEQRRIVGKIDSLTGRSRRARHHIDHIPRLVEKYKQAVLTEAFRGDLTREWRNENPTAIWSSRDLASLREQRETYVKSRRGSRLHRTGAADAHELPAGWFAAELSDVGSLQVGYAYKSKWYATEGVRLLRGANVAPGRVSWEDEVRLPPDLAADFTEYRVDAGDIVIAMDRPIISTGLKVARIKPEDAGCLLVQRVARYVASDLVDDDYVWHLINSQHFIDHAVTQATGSDLPHISSNDILTTPVPLPCITEQKEIARRINVALSWIDRLAAEATSARKLIDHLDQAVLAKAFRGDLVPQDPNDEPASILLERINAERGEATKGKRGRKSQA
ncbi:restriction endonuclease subunit S [Sinorhizobium medicae]|uniref:restriction endonuclease subunit S n=1 Tax=Sinorhizobium medicae TaxID=110321 RepID=UPI0030D1ABD9